MMALTSIRAGSRTARHAQAAPAALGIAEYDDKAKYEVKMDPKQPAGITFRERQATAARPLASAAPAQVLRGHTLYFTGGYRNAVGPQEADRPRPMVIRASS